MSYILDAIKKAEKQRYLDQVPTLESTVAFQDESSPARRIKAIVFGICLIVVVGLGVVFYEPISNHASQIVDKFISIVGTRSENGRPSVDPSANSIEPITENEPDQGNTPAVTEQPAKLEILESSQDVEVGLTEAQKNAIDLINFTVISYSKDAAKRFVMAGSDILREGDEINGFRIIAIEKSSIVLNVDGQPHPVSL